MVGFSLGSTGQPLLAREDLPCNDDHASQLLSRVQPPLCEPPKQYGSLGVTLYARYRRHAMRVHTT